MGGSIGGGLIVTVALTREQAWALLEAKLAGELHVLSVSGAGPAATSASLPAVPAVAPLATPLALPTPAR